MINSQTDFFSPHNRLTKLDEVRMIPIFTHHVEEAVYTISITVYKRAKYIKQCLDSAINQRTNISYEIIVIDDDPTRGNEVEVFMKSYEDTDIVSYYKKSANEGLMNSMNRSVVLPRTEWVVMIHDDDWLCTNYLERVDYYRSKYPQYSIYVPSNKTFYFGKFVHFKKSLREWICKVKGVWRIKPIDFVNGTCATPTGTLYNKAKFIDRGGYNADYGMAADYVFFAEFSAKEKILRINEKLFNYRYAENESLRPETKDNFKIIGHYLSVYLMNKYRWLPKKFRDRYERVRLWKDFHDKENDICRLFPKDEITFYKSQKYSEIIFKTFNFLAKTSTFLRMS